MTSGPILRAPGPWATRTTGFSEATQPGVSGVSISWIWVPALPLTWGRSHGHCEPQFSQSRSGSVITHTHGCFRIKWRAALKGVWPKVPNKCSVEGRRYYYHIVAIVSSEGSAQTPTRGA